MSEIIPLLFEYKYMFAVKYVPCKSTRHVKVVTRLCKYNLVICSCNKGIVLF